MTKHLLGHRGRGLLRFWRGTSRLRYMVLSLAVVAGVAWLAGGYRSTAPPRALASVRAATGYPKGPWWRTDFNKVIVSLAHVLITFEGTERTDGDLTIPGRGTRRAESEALQLALQVAASARANPKEFSNLARKFSEDPSTATQGGHLGIMYARQLPPGIVDALGYTRVGETSRPVRSRLGYHVIRRLPMPPQENLSASQIVIGYKGLPLVFRHPVTRSREEASKLAERVWRQAQASPERFANLVHLYSDAMDEAMDGDMGEWSTYEAGQSIALAALADIKVDRISRIIDDGTYGFRILKRTNPKREALAASAFLIGYRPDQTPDWIDPSITRTRAEAIELSEQLSKQLRADPSSFESVRKTFCDYELCRVPPYRYLAGRSPWVGLDRELLRISPGESTTPVETYLGFVIAQREEPERWEATMQPKPEFEFPHPPRITLQSAKPELLVNYVTWFGEEARERLELAGDDLAVFNEVLGELKHDLASIPASDRAKRVEQAREKLSEALGHQKTRLIEKLHEELNDEAQGAP